jgi:hypothetical protein
LPPRKHTKTDTSVAEKEPRGQPSAEALARAALANVDANRPAPSDAPIEPGLADARSAPVDVPVDIQPRRAMADFVAEVRCKLFWSVIPSL